jgi:hypothetical protein
MIKKSTKSLISMLEGLGSTLRKTTDKIANAIFLDKNLVDQILRDLVDF